MCIASSLWLSYLPWSWFNSINCKSDKTQLLDLLIKACWEIQLEAGASSNDRKKKKNEARRVGGYHPKYFIPKHILFDAVFVPPGSRGADESQWLCAIVKRSREGGGETGMIARSGSQLISDIRDRIITGCQSQSTEGPGNTRPSAVCSLETS